MKVLCIENYVKNDIKYWSSETVYDAVKCENGNYSIQTNYDKDLHSQEDCFLADFNNHFIDISKKVSFLDAVRYCFAKGYFTISDTDNYGCMGLHCETNGINANGFYCFEDADIFEGTPQEYIALQGNYKICQDIATTLEDFANIDVLADEALGYFLDMQNICKDIAVFDEVLEDKITKTEAYIESLEYE